jgi:hypothetical protein
VGRIANPAYSNVAPAGRLGASGAPLARDRIGAIVISTWFYICRFVPRPAKNGAPMPIRRARLRAQQPGSLNVRSSRRACCNPIGEARSTAKWRFGPSKRRHLPSIFAPFSTFFPVFFRELALEGAIGRECDLQKDESRRVRLPCTGLDAESLAPDGLGTGKTFRGRLSLSLFGALLHTTRSYSQRPSGC